MLFGRDQTVRGCNPAFERLVGWTADEMNDVSDARELSIRSVNDDSRNVLVAVGDSGPGLDPRNLDRLFQAFYTTKPHGMGMGVAISRSIVETLGGRLRAVPNVPRGAVFQFTLPIGGEKPRDTSPSVVSPPAS